WPPTSWSPAGSQSAPARSCPSWSTTGAASRPAAPRPSPTPTSIPTPPAASDTRAARRSRTQRSRPATTEYPLCVIFGGRGAEPWERFADAVLRQEIVRVRAQPGADADPYAGLHIPDESVDRILERDASE